MVVFVRPADPIVFEVYITSRADVFEYFASPTDCWIDD